MLNHDLYNIKPTKLISKTSNFEKALILSNGKATIKDRNFKKNLKKFDCLHTIKSFKNFDLECKKGSQLFIILGMQI